MQAAGSQGDCSSRLAENAAGHEFKHKACRSVATDGQCIYLYQHIHAFVLKRIALDTLSHTY